MNHKELFQEAFIQYIEKAELRPVDEAFQLHKQGKYHHLCTMKVFTLDEPQNTTPYWLIIPSTDWNNLLQIVDKIFESKINDNTLDWAIDSALSIEIDKLPLTQELLMDCAEKIFSIVWDYYNLRVVALVPLYNLHIKSDIEMQLGQATLYYGHPNSIFAEKTSHPKLVNLANIETAKHVSFLQVEVGGDSVSQLRGAELATEQALMILRFVTMWISRQRGNSRYNPAKYVGMRESKVREIIYYFPDDPERMPFYQADIEDRLFLNKEDVETAKIHYGLDNINHHFLQIDNPISGRIVRSLELYDSGAFATTKWQALYRYVVCINTVIPTSSSTGHKIAQYLEKLIKHGGNYIYKLDNIFQSLNWDELIKQKLEPFTRFYELRGKILHGNEMTEEVILDNDLEHARELAHNTVRLMAKLAKEFNWQGYKEAKNWFKTPTFPPNSDETEDEKWA